MPIEVTTLEPDPALDAEVLSSVPPHLTVDLRHAISEQLAHPDSRGWDGSVDDAKLELGVRLAAPMDGCPSCTRETVDACERAIRAETRG